MSNIRYVPHPGEYIKDTINELGMTQNEFAIRIGTTGKTISKIISGSANITFDIASKLSDFLGTGINVWLNLQTSYNEYIRKKELEEKINEEINILKYFDKDYLKLILNNNECLNDIPNTISKLKRIFMVNSLTSLKSIDLFAFCRTSLLKDLDEKQIILRNAWISLSMYIAKNIKCECYSETKLKNALNDIKNLIGKTPKEFIPKLACLLKDVGIKIVFLPYLKGSNISAVTKWIPNENAIMISVNDFGKDADKFWFNIFHELGHAIINKKRHIMIKFEKNDIIDDDEKFANNFANNELINLDKYLEFVSNNDFSIKAINSFSKLINIPNFVIIGRLQNDGYINWNQYNEYKPKYTIEFNYNLDV